jgi:hypothetical protein
MAATSGRVNFHARVAGNVLDWLRRELSYEQEHLDREWDSLNSLLGDGRQLPAGRLAAQAAVEERNQALCEQIRAGGYARGDARARLFAHLREVTRDKLVVTNPGLLEREAADAAH